MRPEEFEKFLKSTAPDMGYRWRPLNRRNIRRKLQRRMDFLRLRDVDSYLSRVLELPDERRFVESLFRVTISRFFRNASVWQDLGITLLNTIGQERGESRPGRIRVWSAGCAGGEEAYTAALLLMDLEERGKIDPSWTVLGTDTHPESLLRAEKGVYQWGSVREVPEDMRERWFTREEDQWILSGKVMERITLKRHDLLREDPPGRFGLVLLRNSILTYNTDRIVRDVLARVHGCLNMPGILVIGRTESMPQDAGFEMVKKCIYRKKDSGRRAKSYELRTEIEKNSVVSIQDSDQ